MYMDAVNYISDVLQKTKGKELKVAFLYIVAYMSIYLLYIRLGYYIVYIALNTC